MWNPVRQSLWWPLVFQIFPFCILVTWFKNYELIYNNLIFFRHNTVSVISRQILAEKKKNNTSSSPFPSCSSIHPSIHTITHLNGNLSNSSIKNEHSNLILIQTRIFLLWSTQWDLRQNVQTAFSTMKMIYTAKIQKEQKAPYKRLLLVIKMSQACTAS